MQVCSQCGNVVDPGKEQCSYCGYPIEGALSQRMDDERLVIETVQVEGDEVMITVRNGAYNPSTVTRARFDGKDAIIEGISTGDATLQGTQVTVQSGHGIVIWLKPSSPGTKGQVYSVSLQTLSGRNFDATVTWP